MIRKPTAEELAHEIPEASRGWESQREEVDTWVTDIEGTLPLELRGTFIRNGPGVTEVFGTPLKHPIDGDGMVVALTFMEGKVHFRNKFIQTFSHKEEDIAKTMLYNGSMGSRVPGGPKDPRIMRDPSHTNAFYWGNKIMTCYEYGLPHALDPCTLKTLGADNLRGSLKEVKAMCAHFRYDAVQDRLVTIGFKPAVQGTLPKLEIHEYDRQWNECSKLFVQIDGLNYAHDFLMTPEWYVFHMSPFVDTSMETTMKILKGELFPGETMKYKPDLPSRMVAIERKPSGRVIEFSTEPCHIYHFCNAIQTGNKISFGAACLPVGFTMEWQYKAFLSNTSDAPGVYHNYIMDLDNRTCVRSCSPKVQDRSCEFPTSHPYRHCVRLDSDSPVLPPRYVYLMAGRPGVALPFTDLVKYDEQGERDGCWSPDAGGVVGEPVFIPRLGAASAFYGDDDDGWLVTQVYYPGVHKVEYVIIDATTMQLLCRIRAPIHIPYSFHGSFTPEVFVFPPTKL